jgi:hypothetical protein
VVCFLCIGMCIKSTHGCLYIRMLRESPWIHSCRHYELSMPMKLLCSVKSQINWFNFYLNSQFWMLNIPKKKEVPAIKLVIPWIVPECRLPSIPMIL